MKLETIFKLSQEELQKALFAELTRFGYKPQNEKSFLYAKGKIPVLLVAHLDTVHKDPPRIICYSKNKRYLLSPTGIGGDDRCGVLMILEIIKTCKCHVLFTQDEEVGGTGARDFSRSKINPNVNFIIELDRKGTDDAVYYDNDNKEFEDFIGSFGFKTDFGSFSDISIIAPALGISAVNLSSGYFNPHTLNEYVDMKAIRNNIKKIRKIVLEKTKVFEYVETPFAYSYGTVSFYETKYPYDKKDTNYNKDLQKYYDERYEAVKSRSSTKFLMSLDGGYVITEDGLLLDGTECYMDANSKLYTFGGYNGEALVVTEGVAYSTQGTLLKFDAKKAEDWFY